jgi:UDP-N-acetylglucosamine diphosphorylase / glucose-1-phosphate thymidylyltransferase / UDP-N-acetylgalactosamine diphosphorylase / glucosamine-1-phosphate N-acetyltransferase / galactosamine-1-phosphate N-acetyltransferase
MKNSLELPSHMPFGHIFNNDRLVWEWVSLIQTALEGFDFIHVDRDELTSGITIVGDVFLHPTVKLPPYAVIEGPTWIGAHTEIRPGAFIRGNVIIGAHCVIGHECEYKNCLLMDHVETPHFNYIGDSILGNKSHLGAGAILANVRLDNGLVQVTLSDGTKMNTGRRKFGAILMEGAQVGCNSVLQPGTILDAHSFVGPATVFGGYLPARHKALAARSEIIAPKS